MSGNSSASGGGGLGDLEIGIILKQIEAEKKRHAKAMKELEGQLKAARIGYGVNSPSIRSGEGTGGGVVGEYKEEEEEEEEEGPPPSNSASAGAESSKPASTSFAQGFMKKLRETKEEKDNATKERVERSLQEILNKFRVKYPALTIDLLKRMYDNALTKYNEDEFNSVQLEAVIAETKGSNDEINVEILNVVLTTLKEEDISTKCNRCRRNNCGDRPMYAVAGRPRGHTPCDSCRSLFDGNMCSLQGGSRKRSKKSRASKKSKAAKKSKRATRKH